jgi:hypothetical protein
MFSFVGRLLVDLLFLNFKQELFHQARIIYLFVFIITKLHLSFRNHLVNFSLIILKHGQWMKTDGLKKIMQSWKIKWYIIAWVKSKAVCLVIKEKKV